MTIRLPLPLYEQLRKAAFEQRMPMSRIIITALEKQLGTAKESWRPGDIVSVTGERIARAGEDSR